MKELKQLFFKNWFCTLLGKLCLCILLFGAGNSFSQQWFQSYLPHTRYINSIVFLDSLNIVVAGGSEANGALEDIFKSRDGGFSWDFGYNQGSDWFKSMAFKDSVNGIAVGYNGALVRTWNGATSWTLQAPPIARHLHKVVYLNNHTIIIVGGKRSGVDTIQTILKSVDTGNTWSVMRDQHGIWLRSVCFTDSLKGIAVGDTGTILRTTDGGATWNPVAPPIIRDLYDVVFINKDTGFAVGGKNPFFQNPIRTILKTTNGGTSWSVVLDQPGTGLWDLSFLNDSVGYAVGDSSVFMKTRDRGLTWTKQYLSTTDEGLLRGVTFYKENFGVVGGLFGYAEIYDQVTLPAVQAVSAKINSKTNVTLIGNVDTHGEYADYSFSYTPDSTFSDYRSTYSAPVMSDGFSLVQQDLDGLLPDTTYYFWIRARTLAGTAFSDTLTFKTEMPAFTFSTNAASNVGLTTATVNGLVNKFPLPLDVSF